MNPVLYLLQKQWQFSKGNRKKIVFYYCLFLLANIFSQSQPLVIGLIINYIQTQTLGPENFWFLIGLLSIILVFDILFWVFHGPARIIEMTNAFLVRANYKQHLLKGTMDLPITWHNDHHSGDTIDKIEKGTTALFEFSNGTFWIIEGIIMLIISYTVLVFFNIHASYIVLVILGICVAFILRVDKKIIANLRQLNHYENTIASKIFDTIGNITTVVILRVEKLLQKAIWKKIMHPFSLHKRNLLLNETKWAVVSIISSLMVFLVLGSYVYLSLTTGIMLGTIYILYGYVEKIRNLFFRFAWQYGQLVKQMTAVQNSEEIAKD
ncbi:MAG: ABC transporter transmembrane domain-containing protein, partial [Candidatus Woesearchaeota archaeon]